MKSKSIKIIIFSVLILLILSITNTVQANIINNISMEIFIDKNGNAEVTEKWDVNTNSQTECYHPYYNLGNSKITNLRVYDTNKNYTTINPWNTSGSLSSKAYKCGINKIDNGVELCWGISNYGSNTYTVKYNISNFVSQLTDSQMIYWTLIPYEFSNEIKNVDIRIYADKNFSDTIELWGYGKKDGICGVKDGVIYIRSEGVLKKSEYITILVKLPKGMFNTINNLQHDFNYYYEMAEKGAKHSNFDIDTFTTIIKIVLTLPPILLIFFPVLKVLCIIILIMALISSGMFWIIMGIWLLAYSFVLGILYFLISFVLYKKLKPIIKAKLKKFGFKYGKAGEKIRKDIPYFRDIPCNGDIFRTYYIAYQYSILKKKTDFLGAVILKWLKEGRIIIEDRNQGKDSAKEDIVVALYNGDKKPFSNKQEEEIFALLKLASKDGILENNELEKWCKSHADEMIGWFDMTLEDERKKLVEENLIICKQERGLFSKKYIATQELKDLANQIAGLKKYLLDYTLINKREAIEVELFEEYLIYAQMLGIANKVSKQFEKMYPDVIVQTSYLSYHNLLYVDFITSRGVRKASFMRGSSQFSISSGGFSSGGGTGSFGGGGGGGGGFR